MFGHDDNQQQQVGDDNTVMQAAMPEALGDNNFTPDLSNASPVSSPTMSAPHIVTSSVPSDDTPAATNPTVSAPTVAPIADDLLNLKQQALQHLSPLVNQLDQTPEEKFRTTMMMIQASDDRTLIKTAFEAAQAITDDKARAQSLLDIINEINYFTQHQQ